MNLLIIFQLYRILEKSSYIENTLIDEVKYINIGNKKFKNYEKYTLSTKGVYKQLVFGVNSRKFIYGLIFMNKIHI